MPRVKFPLGFKSKNHPVPSVRLTTHYSMRIAKYHADSANFPGARYTASTGLIDLAIISKSKAAHNGRKRRCTLEDEKRLSLCRS